jgi:hypothetical protein
MRKFISLSLTLLAAFIFCACGGDNQPPASIAPTTTTAATTPTPAQRSLPKIVALGDSLTSGYGLALHESYPSLLQEQLKRDNFEY